MEQTEIHVQELQIPIIEEPCKKKTKNVIRNINMQPCNIFHISIVNYVINPESFISKVYPQRS